MSTIGLPASPEGFQVATRQPRLYVNVGPPFQVIVVNTDKNEVIARHPLRAAKGIETLALDEANGRIFVQDNQTDLATLGDELRSALGAKRNPTKERIFIRADKDVLYGDFMGVMNMLQDNGFYSVALVGEDKRR